MEDYFYRVTESYYESSDVHIDFYPSDKNALDRAKEHVDDFYKNSNDNYETCCISKVQEEIVEYISLFAYPEYKNLTEDDKKDIILKYLDQRKKLMLVNTEIEYENVHSDICPTKTQSEDYTNQGCGVDFDYLYSTDKDEIYE